MLQPNFCRNGVRSWGKWLALPLPFAALIAFYGIPSAHGQQSTFSSGSTGADGALTLTTPGIVYFNPKTFIPPLDPAGDNVFNFTTITIASGVTLKLTSKILTGPVIFLAQGDVRLTGRLTSPVTLARDQSDE